jgi:hypothetical protein
VGWFFSSKNLLLETARLDNLFFNFQVKIQFSVKLGSKIHLKTNKQQTIEVKWLFVDTR